MKNRVLSSFLIANVLYPLSALSEGAHNGHHNQVSGEVGKPENVTKKITVEAFDSMKFLPNSIDVKKGETVEITLVNKGKVIYELVLGDKKELDKHAKMMMNDPHMKHTDSSSVTAEPGKSASLVWKFTETGTVDFACLLPGHYQAGMTGKIKVK
jgi:uncharacterized cupredoxin-like copper-binding protein